MQKEEGRAQETDLKTIIVNQDTLNLDSADVKEYAEYGRQLAAVLKGVDNQGEDKAIKAFCESHKNPVFERIDGVIAENSRSGKNIYLKMTSGFNEEYVVRCALPGAGCARRDDFECCQGTSKSQTEEMPPLRHCPMATPPMHGPVPFTCFLHLAIPCRDGMIGTGRGQTWPKHNRQGPAIVQK